MVDGRVASWAAAVAAATAEEGRIGHEGSRNGQEDTVGLSWKLCFPGLQELRSFRPRRLAFTTMFMAGGLVLLSIPDFDSWWSRGMALFAVLLLALASCASMVCDTSHHVAVEAAVPRHLVPAGVGGEGAESASLEQLCPAKLTPQAAAEETCVVCLESIRAGDSVRVLQCRHAFHRSCIDSWWLCQMKKTRPGQLACPTCRGVHAVVPDSSHGIPGPILIF